jgi:signal transduction histidine kinase
VVSITFIQIQYCFFLTITATIPDCFISSRQFYYVLFGVDGKLITANRFFIETFSLNNDVSEKNIFSLFTASDSTINIKEITGETKNSQDKPISFTLKNPNHFPEIIYIKWEVSCLNDNADTEMMFQAIGTPVNNVTENISERKKLEQELVLKERTKQKQIAQAAINAQEKERADVGRELHDNISQMLTSTKLFLDILNKKSPDEMIERSVKNINTIIAEVRNITRSLVPAGIEELGLIASLYDLLDNIKITNIIDLEFFPDITVENLINTNYKLTLYRIVQEQINNIVKHASASHVIVELFQEGNNVELIITDNGQGFDLNKIKKGHGLYNMRSRAELINGIIEIITSPGKGCKLKVNIPCQ